MWQWPLQVNQGGVLPLLVFIENNSRQIHFYVQWWWLGCADFTCTWTDRSHSTDGSCHKPQSVEGLIRRAACISNKASVKKQPSLFSQSSPSKRLLHECSCFNTNNQNQQGCNITVESKVMQSFSTSRVIPPHVRICPPLKSPVFSCVFSMFQLSLQCSASILCYLQQHLRTWQSSLLHGIYGKNSSTHQHFCFQQTAFQI